MPASQSGSNIFCGHGIMFMTIKHTLGCKALINESAHLSFAFKLIKAKIIIIIFIKPFFLYLYLYVMFSDDLL